MVTEAETKPKAFAEVITQTGKGKVTIYEGTKEDFLKYLQLIVDKAAKIIVTNSHQGKFEYHWPKKNPRPKGQKSLIEKAITEEMGWYELGSVIVSEACFEGEPDFKRALATIENYRAVTILWREKEK